LRTTLTNQNSIQKEIKSKLKSGNACYHSVQNLFSSSLLSNNIKIKVHRTITLSVVLYECETWSPTMKEESTLRMFENTVLRRIFGPRKDEETGEWRKPYNEELLIFMSFLTLYYLGDQIEKNDMEGACSTYGGQKRRIQAYGGETYAKEPLGRPKLRWEDNIKMNLKWDGRAWTGLSGSG